MIDDKAQKIAVSSGGEVEVTPAMIEAGVCEFEKWFGDMALHGFFEEVPCRAMIEQYVVDSYASMSSVMPKSSIKLDSLL